MTASVFGIVVTSGVVMATVGVVILRVTVTSGDVVASDVLVTEAVVTFGNSVAYTVVVTV